MRNKMTSSVLLFWNKMKSGKIDFPLKNIKRIAIRPSEAKGELLYSLPLVETLQKKYKVTLLLPDDQNARYFRRLRVKIITYPSKKGLISLHRLKNRINKQFDLLIDLNGKDSHVFTYVLKNPIVASIFDSPGVNITAKAKTKSITNRYQYLIKLLGFPEVKWKTKAIRAKRSRKEDKGIETIGISSDINVSYHGLTPVPNEEDLRKISKLVTQKNDLSAIAFFLKIPQVLLLEEKDNFKPPESIKVLRYSRKITPKIIGDCLAQ
jgi:hypothetical protein